MNNDVYNPYQIGNQNINQNYYGPGYCQPQPYPIGYTNVPYGYNPNIGSLNVSGGAYGGINSGYYSYSNMGSNYYNPYLEQKKKERAIEEAKKSQKYQSDIMKRLSKNSHNVLGVYNEQEFEKHAKQYDPIWSSMTNEEYMEYTELENLARVHELSKMQENGGINQNSIIYQNQKIDRINREIDKNKNKFGLSDDMSMMEFFDIAGDILLEQKIEETRRGRRDMGSLYNRDSYGKLIDLHSGKHNYFNSIGNANNLGRLKHHNIDDMEVTLPSNMSEQYAKRKAEFINQLLNG